MQDISVKEISEWGNITKVVTAACTTSVPSTVNITGNSHTIVSATQPGSSQRNMIPQNSLINGSPSNMGHMTQGTEFVTSTSHAEASIPQDNMLQSAQTIQSESYGIVLPYTRKDPLLSSAGYNANQQTSESTNSAFNLFPQTCRLNQSSQPPTTSPYTDVSSDIGISDQSQVCYGRF